VCEKCTPLRVDDKKDALGLQASEELKFLETTLLTEFPEFTFDTETNTGYQVTEYSNKEFEQTYWNNDPRESRNLLFKMSFGSSLISLESLEGFTFPDQ
jgi:hypothetical protein